MRLSHIEHRIEQQLLLKDLIANAVDNLNKVGYSNITPQRVHTRLKSLEETWEKFSLVHEAIGLAMTKLSTEDKSHLQQHMYFSENLFLATHETYLEAVEKMNLLLESEPERSIDLPSTHSATNTSSLPVYFHHARLPRIDIPKFNGSPSDWLSFKDLYSSLILANPTLSPVEKLQYLKTSLVGSASLLLKNTTLTADNFQKAWDALTSFYENKRLLINAALHSLVTLKRMTKESGQEMEQLYTNIMQIYRTLETLQRPVNTWDDFLVFITVQRLDSESVKAWEHHLGSSKEPPTWSQFSEFLVTRMRSLQAFEKSRTGKSTQSHQNLAKSHFQSKAKETKSSSCSICSSDHYITQCPQYNSKTVPQRVAIIQKHKLCYNCLGNHRASACRTPKRCQKCGHKHHTTIHQVNSKSDNSDAGRSKSDNVTATGSKPSETQVLHSAIERETSRSHVLLATAQVVIVTHNGETAKARALIDQGSEISLISEHLVQLLRLPRSHSTISLLGIGAQKSPRPKGVTHFTLKPHFNSDSEFVISAYILPKLTSSLPSAKTLKTNWPHLEGILLADHNYSSPGSIDLILGADIYAQIIEEGIVKGDVNSPIAQKTKLGWIISGPFGPNVSSTTMQGFHISLEKDLHDLLHRFWQLEEIPSSANSSLSTEDQECEQHFNSTHSRDVQGRYIVQLPFKQSVHKLGNSRSKALRILTNLRRKLASDQNYANAYSEFLNEYENLHHMKRVPDAQPEPTVAYYLPHHGIFRESSLTTKLRVVFNGSNRTDSGSSLNDLLHTGAKLQIDLFDVLIWFRQFHYVFSTDVEKMYRQIQVHPQDWDFQRILWVNSSDEIITYHLTTVTYGLACAPFLALRTFAQLVEDEGNKYPLAVPTLKKGRYVDDVFGGADTIHQAQEIVQQLTQLCMAGGFPLQKWISNHPAVIKSIPSEKQIDRSSISFEDNFTVHILGLYWNPSTDNFHFSAKISSMSLQNERFYQ